MCILPFIFFYSTALLSAVERSVHLHGPSRLPMVNYFSIMTVAKNIMSAPSGQSLFTLSWLISPIMTGVLYIFPYIYGWNHGEQCVFLFYFDHLKWYILYYNLMFNYHVFLTAIYLCILLSAPIGSPLWQPIWSLMWFTYPGPSLHVIWHNVSLSLSLAASYVS